MFNTENIVHIIFFIAMCVVLFVSARNLVEIVSIIKDRAAIRSRMNQFSKMSKDETQDTFTRVENFSKNKYIKLLLHYTNKYIPSYKKQALKDVEENLKFIQWDDTFTPNSFMAVDVFLKVFGGLAFVVFSLFGGNYILIGALIFVVAFFGLRMMYESEIKTKKENLLIDFPELIRIVSGYLCSGMDLVSSFSEASKYVSDDWGRLLKEFEINSQMKDTEEALNILRNSVDIFEVSEFVALVKLMIEQGGDVKDGFLEQADKIRYLQRALFDLKIGKRKTWGTILQGPLLLVNLAVLALPILYGAMQVFG